MDGPAHPDTAPTHPASSADRGPSSPHGQAAAAALVSLSRAARSFVLYAPGNAMVRQLLEEYQAKTYAVLNGHGPLEVAVRPFEMVVSGEVVYRDTDREKSLAFKLFRDGVRRLTLLPQVTWEELLQFLEILAVRCTVLRQQEEDTVTLLRKAEFQGITVVAVEGFIPAEEEPEVELDRGLKRARGAEPPAGWDTPLPKLPPPGPIAYRRLPEEALVALRGLEGDDPASIALSLARDLLAEGARAGWPSPNPDLIAFFAELRDGLLADGQLASLRRLVDLLAEAGKGDLRDQMLRGLGDARTLDLVLASLPEDALELPPDLIPFLPLLGIEAALDRLAGEASDIRRRLLTQIVLSRLPAEADVVLARLPTLEPQLAGELGRGLVARAPERATEVGRQFLAQHDEALRLEGLSVLEAAPSNAQLRPLCNLLRDPSEAVRILAAQNLGRRRDESVFSSLRAALEEDRNMAPREAEVLGRALAHAAPSAAKELFAAWLSPRARFLRGLTAEERTQQWAAVAGTGELPGADAEATLLGLAERSKGDLRRHCLTVLARRRKGSSDARR
jgi:hypothetical protein